ncbi:MAG: hypothetical protein WBD32_02445 [Acidobacteriaceae bacterium]
MGIAPVVRVDHRPVNDGSIGAITREVRRLYFEAARGHLRAYRKWVVPALPSQQEAEPHAAALAESMVER